MERTLYNGLLSGVSLDGKSFFYPNPLESSGQHQRSPWFGCACCPGNITRFLASVPGYVYAHQGDRSTSTSSSPARPRSRWTAAAPCRLVQETRYPWDGAVRITRRPRHARPLRPPRARPRLGPRRARPERPLPLRHTRPASRSCSGSTAQASRSSWRRASRASKDAGRRATPSSWTCRCRCAGSSRTPPSRPTGDGSPSSAARSSTPPSGRTTRTATSATSCSRTTRP